MPIGLKLLLALLLVQLSLCWDYSRQYLWPETCTQGRFQSPINIPDMNELSESEIRLILEHTWGKSFGAPRMLDNGHYLICYLMADSGQLLVRGLVPDMPLTFNVDEFHFTSPSEHTVARKSFDLEMQIVHTINTEYLPHEEKLTTRKLVISVLFQARSGANNTFINSLNMNTLDFIPNLGIDKLMKTLPRRFVFYEGSLSRPPCSENVYRIVYIDPQPISPEQLRYFTQYYQRNARDLQETGSRAVLRVTRIVNNGAERTYLGTILAIIILLIALL